jgi:hypothetical protein
MLEQSPNFLFGHSRFCERDSSGTTKPPTAAKVMERIARREQATASPLRSEAARPKKIRNLLTISELRIFI